MSWLDEQTRQRKQRDQEIFEQSFLQMASVIMGNRGAESLKDKRIVAKNAIEDILKFYHIQPTEMPDAAKTPEEQLDYALRPHGMTRRTVELDETWYRDGFAPMIAYRKEDAMPVAVFPAQLRGYWRRDASGRKVKINAKAAAEFERYAICFYRPLPLRPIGIPDLMAYMKDCLNAADVGILLALTAFVTLAGMMTPRITKFLTGFVYASGNASALLGTAAFMACVAISSEMIAAANSLASERLKTKTSLAVEAAMMMRLISLPASFFQQYSAGELSSRSQSIHNLCDLLIQSAFTAGLASAASLLYIAQIFQFAPTLTLPATLVLAATVSVTLITTFMEMRHARLEMESQAKESGLTYALITGIQKIKLAGAEKRAFAKWADAHTRSAALQYNPPLFLKIRSSVVTAVSLTGTIALYYLAVRTRVEPSAYIAFNAAYGMVMGAFVSLAGIALSIARIKPILEMAEPILKAAPETAENKEILTRVSGGIEFSHVFFRYRDAMPYVVNDLSLKIRPGEYIALVGKTGCGKSTLMRLLLGFETPERGAIYYDGKDMSKLDLHSLRKQIGAVTQDGSLFQGDIYSNIAISAPELTMKEAWEAAEISGIADDIRAMPMGMRTIISEGQGGISGGQKQRLMIARAIAPKPKILMFDEATSALDNKTQKRVSEALDRLKCTRIVIAHRLSTIRNCDRILMLDGGKVIEDGSYDQLIAKNGCFAELVARQRVDAGN